MLKKQMQFMERQVVIHVRVWKTIASEQRLFR